MKRFHTVSSSSSSTRLSAAAGLAALLLASCGPGPQPVEESRPPAGHPPAAPPTNPHVAPPADPVWSGSVRLRGELGSADGGYLFLSVRPTGVRFPSYSHKLVLGDEGVAVQDGDDRVVAFELNKDHKLGGLQPGVQSVELQVWYDLDGSVDTKETGSLIRLFPIDLAGDTGVEAVLDPDEEN